MGNRKKNNKGNSNGKVKNRKMRKIIICLVTILNSVVLNAQIPTSIDLKEEGAYQRRDLSTIGSRIVINPYDFGKSPQENTAVVYSNSEVLPLNVAYLTAQNVYHEKERRFGREFKMYWK